MTAARDFRRSSGSVSRLYSVEAVPQVSRCHRSRCLRETEFPMRSPSPALPGLSFPRHVETPMFHSSRRFDNGDEGQRALRATVLTTRCAEWGSTRQSSHGETVSKGHTRKEKDTVSSTKCGVITTFRRRVPHEAQTAGTERWRRPKAKTASTGVRDQAR